MPIRALSAGEVAKELGRSVDWLIANRADLAARGMPAPIHERGGLVWSAPALYRWLDEISGVPPEQRAHVAAYRAALEAAAAAPIADDEVAASAERLERKWGSAPVPRARADHARGEAEPQRRRV